MNRVDLVGYLTRDPELKHTTSGRAVCQMNLRIRRTFTSQSGESSDYINVVVWDKQAENVSKYLKQDRLVSVEGRLQSRSYEDKDGKKVYVTEVIASSVQFLSTGTSNNRNTNTYDENPFDVGRVSEPSEPSKPVETVSLEKDEYENMGKTFTITDGDADDDLPF